MNHTLLIMRHAKSDWSSGAGSDFDRPLNARGVKDAGRMGRWLKSHKYKPDCIVSSPAIRAIDTILNVCRELQINAREIIWDKQIYEAQLDDLLAVIATYAEGAKCLMLVGHNPGLDALVSYLSRDEPVPNASGKLMTTAAIAILDYGKEPLTIKRAGAGLEQIARPKEI